MKQTVNRVPILSKCDICIYRKEAKDIGTCKICSDNRNYISRYKADPIVDTLKEYLGIDGNILNYQNACATTRETK